MGRTTPANRFTRIMSLQRFHSSDKKKTEVQLQPTTAPVLPPSWSAEDIEMEDELLSSTMSKLESERSQSTSSSSNSSCCSKRVRFGDCVVRSYSQVLGEHPYCSVGCPLELGWEYDVLQSLTVDDYEATRGRRSPRHDLRLSPEERRSILQEYSDVELRRACRKLSRSRDTKRNVRRVQKEFFATI
jgi:hypothetical protein